VPDTYADVSELAGTVGYRPATPVRTGVANFVSWYRSYFSDEMEPSLKAATAEGSGWPE